MDSDLGQSRKIADSKKEKDFSPEDLFILEQSNLIEINSKTIKSSISKPPQIWTVASGKGGVGKTFISSSLAISLGKLGKKVTVLDLDYSGANVHTALGMDPQTLGLRQFLQGQKPLSECVTKTNISNVSFIQGLWDSWSSTDLTEEQSDSILKAVKTIKADYVIIDLGAGTLKSHLKAFTFADEKFLVTFPEPTSLEKNYRFLEAYLCEYLRTCCNPYDYAELIQSLRTRRIENTGEIFSFRAFVESHSNIQLDFFSLFRQKPIRIVINGSRSQQNHQLSYSLKSVCRKYFDLIVDTSIVLDFDNAVWQSIRSREPALIAHPMSGLSGQFLSACKQVIDLKDLQKVI
ncbi:MAG: P-loop NTPase [Pseudobdellovibrionaceae bacterium]